MKGRKKEEGKASLVISLVFHGIIVLAVLLWAAKTGKLDFIPRAFDVVLDRKKPEPEKPKEEPKPQPELPPEQAPEPVVQKNAQPPPASIAPPANLNTAPPPVAAPPAGFLPSMVIPGAKSSSTAPASVLDYYKNVLEFSLKANWDRPESIVDPTLFAEVEISLNSKGEIIRHQIKTVSGNKKWDDSIRAALAKTKSIGRPPPKDFPSTFIVRFDLASEATTALE